MCLHGAFIDCKNIVFESLDVDAYAGIGQIGLCSQSHNGSGVQYVNIRIWPLILSSTLIDDASLASIADVLGQYVAADVSMPYNGGIAALCTRLCCCDAGIEQPELDSRAG